MYIVIILGCKCVLQVILPETLEGREWHTSIVIHSSPKIRIICFGGVDDWPEDGDPVPMPHTTMVELCKYVYNFSMKISSWSSKLNPLSQSMCS